MSDEVEVVIIATGFPAGGQTVTGTEDRSATARKVSSLSEKIDRAYNNGMGGANMAGGAPVSPQSVVLLSLVRARSVCEYECEL